jgi:ketosteroid isomerase-like protein
VTRDACPSDWALELHLLDEAPGHRADAARHVATCARCQATLAAKRADGERYMSSPDAASLRLRLVDGDRAAEAPAARPRIPPRRLVAVGLAAAALVAAVALWATQRTALTEEQRDILELERQWSAAVVRGDDATLDHLLADNYTATDRHGNVTNRADELLGVRARVVRYSVYDSHDLAVRVDGDNAVVTGRMTLKGVTVKGKTIDTEVGFVDTLTRIDGRWRATSARILPSGK